MGKLGTEFSLEEAQDAARIAALNVVAQAQHALGSLDRVKTVLRVAVYLNSHPDNHQQSQAANGASDLFLEIFGEAGRHTRMAVGVAALPYNVCAEVEAVFAVTT
ncbi:MAG: RidA family protein [Pseudomonadota bacterium]